MTAAQMFSIANVIALAGWIVLIIGGRRRWISLLVAAVLLLFALLYTGLIVTHWKGTEGGFGTLAAVQRLFSNQWLMLAGWVHYLAFDLFVGNWQVRDAHAHGIPHWAIAPGLILTFLFGPAGLLLYFAVRTLKSRRLTLDSR
jgi:hypothetical protein